MNRLTISFLLLFSSYLAQAVAQEPEQKFASLGDFQLENGQQIKDLKLGYRTAGKLNDDQSNAVLFPTWAGGTTANLVGLVGPGKLVDSSKYFVILVDAFANGVSSSPSNSKTQPHMHFPQFNIRDIVRADYELATKQLKLRHLRAVIGISMGGMQTFQWVVSYPNFMDKAIPIVGSPRLSSYDLLLFSAIVHAIKTDPLWHGGDYTAPPAVGLATAADIRALALTTPQYYLRHVPPQQFQAFLEKTRREMLKVDGNDDISQLQAMMANDVSAPFGGSMQKAAAAAHAKMLVIVGLKDHLVNPTSALDFAKLLLAPTLELDSDCGHGSFECEQEKVNQAVARFLEK